MSSRPVRIAFITLLAALLPVALPALPAASGRAQTGTLLNVASTGTLSAAEVDAAVQKLFDSYPSRAKPPRARWPVETYLIRYTSTYPEGAPAQIVAQLFVPVLPDRQGRPLYVFAPGSTGLIESCRPSREHVSSVQWRQYRAHVLAFAGQGVIGVMPDYMGFNDVGRIQPYFHAVSEGRMMLDSVRAANGFFAGRSARAYPAAAFVAGYSQGGHAAFAAADLRAGYAPELRLDGVIGYGPTTDPEALLREFTVVAPLLVYSYSTIYGKDHFDPAGILADRWAKSLADDVTRLCVGGIQSYYPWTVRRMFQPRFADALLAGRLGSAYPEIRTILAENRVGLAGHRIPAIVLQGVDDAIVLRTTQDRFVTALRRAGSRVLYLVYRGTHHDTRQIAFARVLQWMEARTAERMAAPAERVSAPRKTGG